jgi:hypothetical protein
MPTVIHADPCNPSDFQNGIEIPAIPRDEWFGKLAAIAGRPLTADEVAQAEQMGRHNWTLRVVAERLFGEEKTAAYFAR